VALAGDGLDALRALEGLSPDAILLDLMMPRMNGEEFVQELSRRGRRAAFPIIILSADTRARQTADQVGARACLTNPSDVDDLLNQLERAVTQ
jgi:CheY-like chemotaxis protein